MPSAENFVFILLRPNYLGNIGSTARAMKNFGFDQLRLVNPPRNYLDAEARKMAVDAFDVLKKARVFDSLSAALHDVTVAVGSSSGQYRTHTSEYLAPLCRSLMQENPGEGKIAMVFGDERNGMTNEEIERCHRLMKIESDPAFPSLNLSQASGVVAYQLSANLHPDNNFATNKKIEGTHQPATFIRMDGALEDMLVERLDKVMSEVEFSRPYNKAKLSAEVRTTLQKANLSQREGQIWHGLLSKLLVKLTADDPD